MSIKLTPDHYYMKCQQLQQENERLTKERDSARQLSDANATSWSKSIDENDALRAKLEAAEEVVKTLNKRVCLYEGTAQADRIHVLTELLRDIQPLVTAYRNRVRELGNTPQERRADDLLASIKAALEER